MKEYDNLFAGGNPHEYTYEELWGEDWRIIMQGRDDEYLYDFGCDPSQPVPGPLRYHYHIEKGERDA